MDINKNVIIRFDSGFFNSVNETRSWKALILDLQKSFETILIIYSVRISAHSVNTNVLFRSTVEINLYNFDSTIPWISFSGSFGSINSFLWQLSWIAWHHFGYIKVRMNEKIAKYIRCGNKVGTVYYSSDKVFRSSLALSCLWKINDVAKPESHQLFKCWISKKHPGGQSLVVIPYHMVHMRFSMWYGPWLMDHGSYDMGHKVWSEMTTKLTKSFINNFCIVSETAQ